MDFVNLLLARVPRLHQTAVDLLASVGKKAGERWSRHLAPAFFSRAFAEFLVGALGVCVFALLGCL